MLCLDFGTSFSKAFVSVEGESELDLIELPLGDGTRGTRLATPSELLSMANQYFLVLRPALGGMTYRLPLTG
jgi:hypothetical protein